MATLLLDARTAQYAARNPGIPVPVMHHMVAVATPLADAARRPPRELTGRLGAPRDKPARPIASNWWRSHTCMDASSGYGPIPGG